MTLSQAISLSADIPILVTVVYAALLYRQLSKPLKVFSWFLFLSGIIQATSLALWILRTNNMPLLHLYVATGLPCLVWFYKTVLGRHINAAIMWGTASIFLLFTIINSIWIQDIYRFNSYALSVQAVIIIILALFTFIYFLSDSVRETGIQDIKSLTWINTGLFIYYLSCLLIFFFGDTIIFRFSKELSRQTWVFHAFLSITMYICFFIGLWKRSNTKPL